MLRIILLWKLFMLFKINDFALICMPKTENFQRNGWKKQLSTRNQKLCHEKAELDL